MNHLTADHGIRYYGDSSNKSAKASNRMKTQYAELSAGFMSAEFRELFFSGVQAIGKMRRRKRLQVDFHLHEKLIHCFQNHSRFHFEFVSSSFPHC